MLDISIWLKVTKHFCCFPFYQLSANRKRRHSHQQNRLKRLKQSKKKKTPWTRTNQQTIERVNHTHKHVQSKTKRPQKGAGFMQIKYGSIF